MNYFLIFICAFAAAALLSYIEYRVSKKVLLSNEKYYSLVSVIRLFINVIFLAVLFFISKKTEWNMYCLLIGGALGTTLPNIFLTAKLLKIYKDPNDKTEE